MKDILGAMAIVVVSDMNRSVAFYRDVLGLKVKYESPGWSELVNGSHTVALVSPGCANPQPPERGCATVGACHLGLLVQDMDFYSDEVGWTGTKPLQDPRTTDFGNRTTTYSGPGGLLKTYNPKNPGLEGSRIAIYTDPDGLPIWIGEMPQVP